MPYLALSFELGERDPEEIEQCCFDAGALSVTLSDIRDDAVLEPAPGEIRLWPATRVQALFDGATSAASLLAPLSAALQLAPEQIEVGTLEDRVWEREWLRDFHAMRFGRRLWICPRHETVSEPDAVVVKLDPGLAFGTGTHPSTALCLQWLDAQSCAGASVIDYGCGSGILGIAAARLGARQVQCFDIDPQALIATADNAQGNEVRGSLLICSDVTQLRPGVDLLVANILAGTLAQLAADLAALIRSDGRVLLAGILQEQADTVTAAYAPWFDIAPFGQQAQWIALAGKRH